MAYRVKPETETDVRQDASANAKSLTPAGLTEGTFLRFEGEKRDEGQIKDAWLKVSFKPDAGSRIFGWVPAAHVEEVPDPPRPPIGKLDFILECYNTEREFNKPDNSQLISHWVISGELLIARAKFETGIENQGATPGVPGGLGPLQVNQGEWLEFVKDGRNLVQDADPENRDHPTLQVRAAAWRMHKDVKAISNAKLAAGEGTAETPFMPTYLDVFQAYLLGDPKAVVAIIDAQKTGAGKDKEIKDVIGWDQAKIDDLFNHRKNILGPTSHLKLPDFVAATDKALAEALKWVFDFTKENAPDELPAAPAQPDVVVVPVDIPGLVAIPAAPPFATAAKLKGELFWPVVTKRKDAMVVSYKDVGGGFVGGQGRYFFANRNGGARHHVGIDIYCDDHDEVVACADGTVVSYYPFYRTKRGEQSYALFVAHEGVVCNYGEVKAGAPVAKGKVVKGGEKIGIVSSTDMIHFEAYVPGTEANSRWLRGQPKPPAGLLNPTRFLLELAANATRIFPDGRREKAVGSAQVAQTPQQDAGGGQAPKKVPVTVNSDDLLTLARTIYGEARGEKPAGRAAVAQVIMNRVRIKFRGDTVSRVCLSPAQFSCWNNNDPNRKIIQGILPGANKVFDECLETADQVMKGLLPDTTLGATHYYSKSIAPPFWTKPPAQRTAEVGSHLFFKNIK